jgi:hypothetical protein
MLKRLQQDCRPLKGNAHKIGMDITKAVESIRSGLPCEVAETFVKAASWKSVCKRSKVFGRSR